MRVTAARRAIAVGVVLALSSISGVAVAAPDVPGSERWVVLESPCSPANALTRAVATSPDGASVYVTGGDAGVGKTIAYDALTGNTLWNQDMQAEGHDVAVSPGGTRVFVTGTDDDYFTIAYDATTGNKVWSRRYLGHQDVTATAYALEVSPSGQRIYVTGRAGYGSNRDYVTVAYNAATGGRAWVARYNGPGRYDDEATALGVSPDGKRVFVTGTSDGNTGPTAATAYDYATIAYGASTGHRQWVARYNGPGNNTDAGLSLAVSPDSKTVFVTGRESVRYNRFWDYATLAYVASSGHRKWLRTYNGPGSKNDIAVDVAPNPDGSRLFVTGFSEGKGGTAAFGTIAYNAAGHRLWIARYTGLGLSGPAAMVVSPVSDALYVTGLTATGPKGNPDSQTLAYTKSTGTKLWEARYGAQYLDVTGDIAITPDASLVFVTGWSGSASCGQQSTTIAYNAA